MTNEEKVTAIEAIIAQHCDIKSGENATTIAQAIIDALEPKTASTGDDAAADLAL